MNGYELVLEENNFPPPIRSEKGKVQSLPKLNTLDSSFSSVSVTEK